MKKLGTKFNFEIIESLDVKGGEAIKCEIYGEPSNIADMLYQILKNHPKLQSLLDRVSYKIKEDQIVLSKNAMDELLLIDICKN